MMADDAARIAQLEAELAQTLPLVQVGVAPHVDVLVQGTEFGRPAPL